MGRHNKVQNKRQNRFLVAEAKELQQAQAKNSRLRSIGSGIQVTSAALRIDSKTAMVVAALYVLANAQANAQLVEEPSVPQQAPNQAPDRLCFAQRQIGNTTLSFTCSPGALHFFRQQPQQFHQTVDNVLKTANAVVKKSKKSHCAFKEAQNDKEFAIKIKMPNEFPDETYNAIYDPEENIIEVKPIFTNTHENQLILIHELRHALIAARNRLNKHFHDPVTNRSNGFLLTSHEDYQQFLSAVEPGLDKILNTVKILNNKNRSADDKNLLAKLEKATSNYKPFKYKRLLTAEEISKWQAEGRLGTSNQLKSSFVEKFDFDLKIGKFNQRVGLNMKMITVEKVGEDYFVHFQPDYNLNNNVQKAMLDILAKIMSAMTKGDVQLMCTELDAYLHEALDLYPDLYKYLFPDLDKYHDQRNSASMRQCLDG